jgi:predicted dehydrogenase
MTIDAVEAGKDVYVEKPMAHTIDEGFEMIKAARQHRRIVQVGTQRRSAPMFMKARELMPDIGEMHLVTSQWLNHQASLRDRKLEGALDWKQWLGSSPKRDVDALRFFNWYYFWDYSGGLMVGQAAHIVDAIHWFAGVSYPSAIVCASSPTTLKGGEVPETTTMSIEYPEGLLATFTCGYKAMKYHWFMDQLKQFHGYRARLDVGREWYKLYPQSNEMDMKPSVDERMPGSFEPASRAHIRNFLDCVKSREEPNATVENGQWTNVVLCMAMEALQHRRRVEYDPRTRKMA